VARVMIALWDSSLSALPVAQVMIPQQENECISLAVLPVAWVQFPYHGRDGVFHGIFPGWSHSANPSWASVEKMAQSPLSGITRPVDSEEGGWSPTTDRQWPEKKRRLVGKYFWWYIVWLAFPWSLGRRYWLTDRNSTDSFVSVSCERPEGRNESQISSHILIAHPSSGGSRLNCVKRSLVY